MLSQFIVLNILLLISFPLLQASYRANPQRSHPVSRKSFAQLASPIDERLGYGSEDDFLKEPSATTPPSWLRNLANEHQTNQFMRLLYDRLNLKEPPNVTIHGNDGTGFPSAIVKQLEQQVDEQQRTHHMEEIRAQQRQDSQATIERAILPGDLILSHTCQRQIGEKFNLPKESTHQIDCFRFSKSSDSKSLPTNQVIKQLRIYVKKNFFSFHHEQESPVTPNMLHLYQVFRPTGNGSAHYPSSSLSDTIRLVLSDVRLMSDNWFELTVDVHNNLISLEQIYQQFISNWYGLAINHNLQSSSHRRYYSKKNWPNYLRSNDDDTNESQQRLPYMLVEYGEKKISAGRAPRLAAYRPRPARPCDPKSPCCRRTLVIDLDQGNSNTWDFVIYPRQIDIGECIGLCGTSGSSLKHTEAKNLLQKNEPHAANNFVLIHSVMLRNRNATPTEVEQKSTHCCSYSRTGGLDIMYTTVNGGPIIRKFIPNMIVEDCRCGLPATIQQL